MKERHIVAQLALVVAMMVSCNDEKAQRVDFDELGLSETKTEFAVSFHSIDGSLITESTQLEPNAVYILQITTSDPVGFKFRKTEGFTFVNDEIDMLHLNTVHKYRIRTSA